MNKRIPKTPVDPGYDVAYSNSLLNQLADRKAAARKAKNQKFMLYGFWILVLLFLAGGLGYYGYTQKDVAISWYNSLKAGIPKQDPISTVTADTSCETLTVTVKPATDTEKGKTVVSPVDLGKCYNIAEADREAWKNLFSSSTNINGYADHILSVSSDTGISKSQVISAINDSLTTFVLNLRGNGTSSETTPEPLATTALPADIVPSPVPALAVTVVPYPEKERQLGLAELASLLVSHNIPSVSGTNTAQRPQDRVNWQMWYAVGTGKDYLILNTLGNNLPPACTTATAMTVSLQSQGTDGEVATKAGVTQVWITCKQS